MELKSETLHKLIDLEIENINFLLELINANKTLSLSLINTFVSSLSFNSSPSDIEFYNKMLLELQVSLADNAVLQNDLAEIKAQFEKISSRLDKTTLVNALDAFKEKQSEIHEIELKLHGYTPKLLNRINHNLLNIKSKELRDEIKKVLPTSAEEITSQDTTSSTQEEIDNKPETENEVTSDIEENETANTVQENENIDDTSAEEKNEENIENIDDVHADVGIDNMDNSITTEDIDITNDITANAVSEINADVKTDDTKEITNVVNTEKINEEVQKVETIEDSTIKDEYPSKDSLIISEITGEVTLPFTHTVVDINEFKNPVSARFREGYKLSRERENENILISISIGLKLCFKSDIHPAIIRACRDFDDLDTYLFYLDNNQAEYYPNFKILYKTYPIKNYLNLKN